MALFKQEEAGHGQTQTQTLAARQKLHDASLIRTRRRSFSVKRSKIEHEGIFHGRQAPAGLNVIG